MKLVDQNDVPEVLLNIPPLLFLLIDNATIKEMRQIVGTDPAPIRALCKITSEGMKIYSNSSFSFQFEKLMPFSHAPSSYSSDQPLILKQDSLR